MEVCALMTSFVEVCSSKVVADPYVGGCTGSRSPWFVAELRSRLRDLRNHLSDQDRQVLARFARPEALQLSTGMRTNGMSAGLGTAENIAMAAHRVQGTEEFVRQGPLTGSFHVWS